MDYLDLLRRGLSQDEPLMPVDCAFILAAAMASIAVDYEPGTVPAVFGVMPDLADRITTAEAEIEGIVARGTTEAEFRRALAGYVELWREGVARHRSRPTEGAK